MHPFIIEGENFSIPSYGVMMFIGLVVSCVIGFYRVKKRGLQIDDAIVIVAVAFFCAIVGATLTYMFVTYTPKELWELITSGRLFSGNHFGLVFYGGLIAAIPGMFLGAKLAGCRLSDYIPPLVPCIPIGHGFGRIGCLLAGCCYGEPTNSFLGVIYPDYFYIEHGIPAGTKLFPVQPTETLVLFIIAAVLLLYERKHHNAKRVCALYLLMYAPARFLLEFLRYDSIRGHLGALSTSQIISIPLFALGLALWFWDNLTLKRKKAEF